MFDCKPPYFGVAYYPESWPREQIDEDLDLMVAHGLNTVRVGEFAWSTMEPEEGVYVLSLFREVVDKCRARGIAVIMCTPSATLPAWMEVNYPEVTMEIDTRKATHGARRLSCSSSPRFREFCRKICHALGKEFGRDDNVIGWQIDNELITLVGGKGCTCASCRQDFRRYLEERYGSIDGLNRAWKHNTWSLNFQSFDQIDPPDDVAWMAPSHNMAWAEYKNHVYAEMCREQADVLRLYTNAPIGTDMMDTQQLDYEKTNEALDIIQFNHYNGPRRVCLYLDFLRTLKKRPFWVTETSCAWNGAGVPEGPRMPGFCAANSLTPFALGGEANLYWLFRDHLGGHEQMHGSVVDSWGRDRVNSHEVTALAGDLDKLRPMLAGTRVEQSGVAVVWAHLPFTMVNYQPMQYEASYFLPERAHNAFAMHGYRPDVIGAGADLSPYKLIISPQQYTIDEKTFAARILPWIEAGGTWVAGPLTDVLTPEANKYAHAPLGHIEEWAGVRRAFFQPAPRKERHYAGLMPAGRLTDILLDGETLPTDAVIYDALEVVGENTKARGVYAAGGDKYLAGYAAVTETRVGRGRIILLGAQLAEEAYCAFLQKIAAECGITPLVENAPWNLTVSRLAGDYGKVLALIENSGEEATLTLPCAGKDILTGKTFAQGEPLTLAPYTCYFIKEA